MFYVDYGNSETVAGSVLVELPDELQSAPLAKKYRFWGFHPPSDQDAAHLQQVYTHTHTHTVTQDRISNWCCVREVQM